MQAVILAAGMGKRLGAYTKDNTKCMLPVNGVRLIDRLIPQLATLNLNRIIIVVGYKGENLKQHLSGKYDSLVKIEFIDNPVYDKTNNIYSLSLAKDKLVEDDTILVESDLIFDDSLFQLIADSTYPNLALVAKYESWMDGTMVRIDDELNIVNFIPKQAFKYSDKDSYYKTVNIYKFSKEFSNNKYIPFLDAYCKALGNNEYYEQVLRVITLLNNTDLRALPIGNRKWYEIDDIQDLDIAETLFAEDNQKLPKMMARYGGYWRYPDMLDYCYLVNPYFPTKRMKEELKANFDVLLTEYPSGMRVNALLAGKYFGIKADYTVVGNGAAELIKGLMESIDGKIGVVYPTFEEYPNRKKDMIIPYIVHNADYTYGVDELMDFYESKDVSAILLINPDNPSGNFIPVEQVLSFSNWCRQKGILFVLDESFVDFTDDYSYHSLLQDEILEGNPNMIVVKSISKSYGVPGLRLGVMASANVQLINYLKKDVSIWNINSFAEFYLQIFGKYQSDYIKACQKFIVERKRFEEQLSHIDFLRVLPSQANYFLCEVTQKYTSTKLTQLLLTQFNILIKDCKTKKGLEERNFVRIAIRSKEDNDYLIQKLSEL